MTRLPRGIRLDHGYVQIRIMHNGKVYCRNFGRDSVLARQLAGIHLAKKREEILMGKFGIVAEVEGIRFDEAARLYFSRWAKERDAEGALKHGGADETGRVIESNLIPYFGKRWYHEIKPADVLGWREHRLKTVLGTSVNREQAVLSSIFSHLEDWVKTELVDAFKLPRDQETGAAINPCASVERAPNRKRQRVLSIIELKALKGACHELEDLDMWEICGLALRSLLRKKDLFNLESGEGIEIVQAKTKRALSLPVGVRSSLRYDNFRKRWDAVRKAARIEDCQFRDLRKTGANLVKMKGHSQKLISEFLGHASQRTTDIYMVANAEHLRPIADDLKGILESL